MRIRGFLGRQMNNLKFRSKIVLIYILCVILPLTVISIYYYKDVEIKLKKQNQTDVNYAVDRTYYMLSNLFYDKFLFFPNKPMSLRNDRKKYYRTIDSSLL